MTTRVEPHPNACASSPDNPSEPGEATCCRTEIRIENKGTINIYGCIAGPAAPGKAPCLPSLPATGACVPLALGRKPKKKLDDRLRPYLEQPIPSVLAASFFHTAQRYKLGHEPANCGCYEGCSSGEARSGCGLPQSQA